MGQNSSSTQATSDVFSSDEVQRLEKRFKKLDSDASGSISIAEFISIPELKENPLGNAHLIFSRILNMRILNFMLVIGYLGLVKEVHVRFLQRLESAALPCEHEPL